jgi:hypothetical protein
MVPVVPLPAGYAEGVALLKVPGLIPWWRFLVNAPGIPFDEGFTNLWMRFLAAGRSMSGPTRGNAIISREVRMFAPRPWNPVNPGPRDTGVAIRP